MFKALILAATIASQACPASGPVSSDLVELQHQVQKWQAQMSVQTAMIGDLSETIKDLTKKLQSGQSAETAKDQARAQARNVSNNLASLNALAAALHAKAIDLKRASLTACQ